MVSEGELVRIQILANAVFKINICGLPKKQIEGHTSKALAISKKGPPA
jgi:hypothetical protein